MRRGHLLQRFRDASRRALGNAYTFVSRQLKASGDGCRFCESVRSWVVAQWRRLVRTARDTVDGTARRFGWQWWPRRAEDDSERLDVPVQRFRRQRYAGSRNRRFELHLPPAYDENADYPLVMVLHGCRQDSADIRHITDFDAIADRERFIVVYPFVTGYSGMRIRNCWGWWLEKEIRPGAGEVEDLWHIIEQVGRDVRIDDRRIHIAGLSSGGGMAVAAMVVHADRIASGAAVAGLPYSETPQAVSYGASGAITFKPTESVVSSMRSILGEDGRPSPIFIVHSGDDPVVDIRAAKNLRDSWVECYGLDPARSLSRVTGNTGGVAWAHSRYRPPRRRSVVETFFVDGPGHGWYGGNPGKYSFPDAPDTSELMWRFFKRHPLESKQHSREIRQQMARAS